MLTLLSTESLGQTGPDPFKPFVGIDIADVSTVYESDGITESQYSITSGEVRDVNEDGCAVGSVTLSDVSNRAFLFVPPHLPSSGCVDPTIRIILLPSPGAAEAIAYGLSKDNPYDDYKNNIIVGATAQTSLGTDPVPVYWHYDSGNGGWIVNQVAGTSTPGIAYAVEDTWVVGSALAGRPLRFITSALPGEGLLKAGVGDKDDDLSVQDNRDAWWTYFILEEFARPYELIVDEHLHYTLPTLIPTYISALHEPQNEQWSTPNTYIALEWGPEPKTGNGTWFNANHDDFITYYKTSQGTPPKNWDQFVREWENDQFGVYGGFLLSGVLEYIHDSGFIAGCYGPTSQYGTKDAVNKWDLAALRADAMKPTSVPDGDHQFTTIRSTTSPDLDDYEEAAELWQLDDFDPNQHICLCSLVCQCYCTEPE
ncbi:MAG: hypothetical protein D8M59_11890 [Planctomycetes bacterium]|nr:hypothetical protein [Planctomycetota bacterium]NOG55460.1 hypothetical protein [Planctomycetota bacterium]